MKRKVFLALVLFALMAVGVYAQTEADFTVSSDGKSITIEGYKGSATVVNIPAKIKNLPVTIIDGSAFENNNKITSVTIPNGVTSIGEAAFSLCAYLTSVTIPDSVTSIGKQAFYATSLASVNIPNSVKSIGANAFEMSNQFASLTIGSGVTSIGNNAFQNCTGLTSVTFSGTIPSSGFNANAFRGLGDIRDKYLAAGGGAGTYTRPNTTSTTWTKSAVTATAGTPGLAFALTADGKGYSVSKGTVTSGNVVIPATYNNLPVTQIPNSAFNGVVNINSVTIPASVTIIGSTAFTQCVFLTSVTFQGTIPSGNFNPAAPFDGDLRTKFYAANATNGTPGTYTRASGGTTWTKK